MKNGHTDVLLIEDNPGDADLVRLRLVESDSGINISCVDRLADGLASMAKQLAFGRFAGPEPSRQPWGRHLPQGARERLPACRWSFFPARMTKPWL